MPETIEPHEGYAIGGYVDKGAVPMVPHVCHWVPVPDRPGYMTCTQPDVLECERVVVTLTPGGRQRSVDLLREAAERLTGKEPPMAKVPDMKIKVQVELPDDLLKLPHDHRVLLEHLRDGWGTAGLISEALLPVPLDQVDEVLRVARQPWSPEVALEPWSPPWALGDPGSNKRGMYVGLGTLVLIILLVLLLT